ncbi:hypothetical protein AQUCO_00200815v1 [Aquilegia coerulea]|uniref:Uncharacterized protein n=1 Tax=Aquilegia coerulea TaxID=218851 RepID=A0A2G5F4Z6_AQUCA|nr:hypothetical protein AQUCO_00200815v1 [Aquilegia coerulea]
MATRGLHMIQDENMNVNHGGNQTNVSKAQKKLMLGGSKPLSNITNSGKPSRPNVLKKNLPMKANDVGQLCGYEGATVARQSDVRGTRKKAGPSGRRALADISNSKKLLPHQAVKKTCSMKLDDIAEEGFLHNHQVCIDTMRRGMDLHCFDDDFLMGLGSPPVLPKSDHPKADFSSPPRFMEYEVVPELLNESDLSPKGGILDMIPSPSPLHIRYQSPSLELLMSP